LFHATKNRDCPEALKLIEEERKSRRNLYVEDTYAWILYRLNRLDEARRASDRALALGTREARLLFHAGAIHLAAGDSRGRELIQQALKLNRNFDWTEAAEAQTIVHLHAKE
jgi:tetratricopeptide (TPR) repeat protein